MNMGHVLVTGGAGFIGSQLVNELISVTDKITVIDDLSTGNEKAIPSSDNITFYKESILNTDIFQSVLKDVDYIFHLAARNLALSVGDAKKDLEINTLGTLNMLEHAREYGEKLKRFIYASTSSIYGNATSFPTKEREKDLTSPYATSKYSAEQYCLLYKNMYDLPTVILRLSNVFGRGQLPTNPYCGVVAKFYEAITTKQPLIIYGDGSQTRDFTYIDDVIQAFVLTAINSHAIGNVFNVGTGKETSVLKLAKMVADIYQVPDCAYVYKEKRVIDTVDRRCLSIKHISDLIDWQPKHDLYTGLERTAAWYNTTPN
ncbi:NAD-dependent epimerase/dehydratase family protein [Salipaludibacillus sp. LMS25]|jgi:UDP-glucose 4-epimerase|uniref:NAD-dependent epimerase/dehydratase family protein n=1 Tax=Salipaludibacillus sp. LMS25 TaxID=2924031 RepID=UPI0020CFF1D7|nr:NAD-dependent epimerase/dehydratase family protein [Salipaludibacillus sp. LMS25]UTR15322.1 NAD-dependent epimerase/dehydratase family protein [Salipaludibacillus sp. LMS25]